MKHLIRGLTILVLTLGTSTLAQHDMHDMKNMGIEMGSHPMLEGLTGEALEIAFLSGMIKHHEGAIQMARWILERTQNAEIKEAAEAIIAAQDPEIQQMTQWLQDWYGQGVDEQSATMMQNEMTMMMQTIEASENPDATFLEQMSLHHNSAIDMSQSALLGSNHPELRELATNIIVAQAREIAQYQSWLDDLASRSQLEHLTRLYSHLRQTHLQAPLTVTPLLTAEQLAHYQTLRGYPQN